ncbi:MAG: archease [Gemmatimonadota bacterium]
MNEARVLKQDQVIPGVRELDHTADIGLSVHASRLPDLFRRAAAGMVAVVWDDPVLATGLIETDSVLRGDSLVRTMALTADGPDRLLRRWLEELLYEAETERVAPLWIAFDALTETNLRARVGFGPAGHDPVREVKGVTYHGLNVSRTGEAWEAKVIFDV